MSKEFIKSSDHQRLKLVRNNKFQKKSVLSVNRTVNRLLQKDSPLHTLQPLFKGLFIQRNTLQSYAPRGEHNSPEASVHTQRRLCPVRRKS